MDLSEVEKINNLAKQLKAHNLAANINEAVRMATDIMRREKKGKLQQEAKKMFVEEPRLFAGKPPVVIKAPEEKPKAEPLFDEGAGIEGVPAMDESIEEEKDEEIEGEKEKKIDLEEDAEEILGDEEIKARTELAEERLQVKPDHAADDYDITQEDKTIAELLGEVPKEEPAPKEDHSEEIKHEIEEEIAEVRAQESAEQQPAEDVKEEPAEVIDEHVIEEIRGELAAPDDAAEAPTLQQPKPGQEEENKEEDLEPKQEETAPAEKKEKPAEQSKPQEKADDSEGWVDWTADYK